MARLRRNITSLVAMLPLGAAVLRFRPPTSSSSVSSEINRASPEPPSTLSDSGARKTALHVSAVTAAEFPRELRNELRARSVGFSNSGSSSEEKRFLQTAEQVARLALTAAVGGCGFVVAPKEAVQEVRRTQDVSVSESDGGYMTTRLKRLHVREAAFAAEVGEFSAHGSNDRWPAGHEAAGRPKDGFVLIDPSGYGLKAAVRMGGLPSPPFRWGDCGTRHMAALASAWAFRAYSDCVVIVRSDSGKVHALFAETDGGIRALGTEAGPFYTPDADPRLAKVEKKVSWVLEAGPQERMTTESCDQEVCRGRRLRSSAGNDGDDLPLLPSRRSRSRSRRHRLPSSARGRRQGNPTLTRRLLLQLSGQHDGSMATADASAITSTHANTGTTLPDIPEVVEEAEIVQVLEGDAVAVADGRVMIVADPGTTGNSLQLRRFPFDAPVANSGRSLHLDARTDIRDGLGRDARAAIELVSAQMMTLSVVGSTRDIMEHLRILHPGQVEAFPRAVKYTETGSLRQGLNLHNLPALLWNEWVSEAKSFREEQEGVAREQIWAWVVLNTALPGYAGASVALQIPQPRQHADQTSQLEDVWVWLRFENLLELRARALRHHELARLDMPPTIAVVGRPLDISVERCVGRAARCGSCYHLGSYCCHRCLLDVTDVRCGDEGHEADVTPGDLLFLRNLKGADAQLNGFPALFVRADPERSGSHLLLESPDFAWSGEKSFPKRNVVLPGGGLITAEMKNPCTLDAFARAPDRGDGLSIQQRILQDARLNPLILLGMEFFSQYHLIRDIQSFSWPLPYEEFLNHESVLCEKVHGSDSTVSWTRFEVDLHGVDQSGDCSRVSHLATAFVWKPAEDFCRMGNGAFALLRLSDEVQNLGGGVSQRAVLLSEPEARYLLSPFIRPSADSNPPFFRLWGSPSWPLLSIHTAEGPPSWRTYRLPVENPPVDVTLAERVGDDDWQKESTDDAGMDLDPLSDIECSECDHEAPSDAVQESLNRKFHAGTTPLSGFMFYAGTRILPKAMCTIYPVGFEMPAGTI